MSIRDTRYGDSVIGIFGYFLRIHIFCELEDGRISDLVCKWRCGSGCQITAAGWRELIVVEKSLL
jgi:hypothetical protein